MDGFVFDMSTREVQGRERCLDNEAIPVHVNAIKVSFVVGSLFILANACDATMAAFDLFEEV